MKFFHLSDLHIGLKLMNRDLLEDQRYIFRQVAALAEKEQPDAIVIAGDIYDKAVPSADAVGLFDELIVGLRMAVPKAAIMLISGNHDSAPRVNCFRSVLCAQNLYMIGMPPQTEADQIAQVTLEDACGPVHFYLVPFIRPGHVRHLFDTNGYTDTFQKLLARETIRKQERNVILAHQFFVWNGQNPETCDSETSVLTSGGLDAIDASVLEPFEYAALGHIHGAQKVGQERFCYCGTPYKYSISEEHHQKGITVVELGEKGSEPQIRRLPILCHPDVKCVRGTLEELKLLSDTMEKMPDGSGRADAYVSVVLTDEKEMYDFRERLEELFAHILEIRVDNERTRKRLEEEPEEKGTMTPFQAFASFYEAVRHCPMTEEQETILARMVEEAEEEERV